MSSPLVLMDSERIARTGKRMGYEIVEQNKSNSPFLLFGIDHRGFAVAQLIGNVLEEISDVKIEVVRLPLKNEFDDRQFRDLSDQQVEQSFPIVVDDVIFSGETMFRALRKISEQFDPAEIHTAVMIDRGHRQFPIKAEFFGMELPTKLNEHVSVIVEDLEVKSVELEKR